MKCEFCKYKGCIMHGSDLELPKCETYEPQTIADHIRGMTDEELAKLIAYFEDSCYCDAFADYTDRCAIDDALEWLKKDAAAWRWK